MKLVISLGIIVGVLAWAPAAEAARCKKGQVYRPSIGICQPKREAIREGVYRRSSGAGRRAKVKKPKVKRAPVVVTAPQTNWIIDYYQHVNDWAVKNRAAIIKHAEGL